MIRTTDRMVLIAGQTVLVTGAWSGVAAHSPVPAEGSDSTAILLDHDLPTPSEAKEGGHALDGWRPVDPEAECLWPGPPASTKAPALAAARRPDRRVAPAGPATTTALLVTDGLPYQGVS